jgi:hypothetical protein
MDAHKPKKKLVVVIVIEKLVRPVLFVRILDLKGTVRRGLTGVERGTNR